MRGFSDAIRRSDMPEMAEMGYPSQVEFIRNIGVIAAQIKDAIHVVVADTKYYTMHPVAKEAFKKGVDEGYLSYHVHMADVCEAVAKKLKKFNNIDADPESEIVITPGTNAGMYYAMQTFLNPGDDLVAFVPGYSAFMPMADLFGAHTFYVPIKEEEVWKLDPEELAKVVTPKTKMIFVCNPNNPTGNVYTVKELEVIAQLAVENDCYVLTDELYESTIYDGLKHTSLSTLPGMKERTVTLMGLSKSEMMAGIRIGYTIASPQITKKLHSMLRFAAQCAPGPSQRALKAFYEWPGYADYRKSAVEDWQKKRDLCLKRLNDIEGITCATPRGAFYVFPNITGLRVPDHAFVPYMLKEYKVDLMAGFPWGPQGANHFRICYATSDEKLNTVFDRIEQAAARIRKEGIPKQYLGM